MTSAPQIRLRTVFLLFFCVAVGLTTSTRANGALRATAEITIMIGLLQEADRDCDFYRAANSIDRAFRRRKADRHAKEKQEDRS